ncbi:MAG TPA: alcohol dehydrogenase catalytic domain-containing protein [Anaerovoracaceae bacterium]|nr:alcohol dehydrogenase catalytic domain-containing protein [Anaerovoracaceae bacterium]
MKAAYYPEKNAIDYVDLAAPRPKKGEALIKVKYAGICGSDLHVYHGAHPTAQFPVIPGHEFVGALAELGEDACTDIKPGEIVVAQPFSSCGVCEACITGNDNVCRSLSLLGIHRNGCFAEYVAVPAKKMYRLPAGTDLQLAALAEPLAVAVHDVRRSGLKVGQNALIIGGGPIGLFIALVAQMAGAQVFISEVSEFRLEFARKMGFQTLNPTDQDFDRQVEEITKGKGFDVVFEVSGSKQGIAAMTGLAKIAGTVMVVGMASDKHPVDTMSIFLKQLTLSGVRIHSQEAFASAVDILIGGRLNDKLNLLISKTYALKDVKEAYDYVLSGSDYFKVLLEVK